MRILRLLFSTISLTLLSTTLAQQEPLLPHSNRTVSPALFTELEELARLVDISYCVTPLLGVTKPFQCLSHCAEFPQFELVTTWNTGPLLSDSSGYIALDHGKERVIVAFRGTYSVANTIVDLSTVPQEYVPYPGKEDEAASALDQEGECEDIAGMQQCRGPIRKRGASIDHLKEPKCENCTVHMGFHTAWRHTSKAIIPDLFSQLLRHPNYDLHLIGHSLGGAVAALAALELQARGWTPTITTFGEPRVGNKNFNTYIDARFNLANPAIHPNDLPYRRVTHIDDPVPLLPLTEWGYAMHAGEIFISKMSLSPDLADLQHCVGDTDQACIAGQDSTTFPSTRGIRKRDLLTSVEREVQDVLVEPWGIPSRYKLWELFFAHRDYFLRLGICAPKLFGTSEAEEGEERWRTDLR